MIEENVEWGTSPIDHKKAHWLFREDGTPYIHVCPIEPIKIEIDKEYFREKFEKVLFSNFLAIRLCEIEVEDVLDDLMKCFDEGK